MLSIEIQHLGNTAILRCRGRVVQGDGVDLLRRIAMGFTEGHIIVDLSHVSSVDAGGLGVLAELQTLVGHSGRKLTLLDPSDLVRDLLMVTNLESVLRVTTMYADEVPPEVRDQPDSTRPKSRSAGEGRDV